MVLAGNDEYAVVEEIAEVRIFERADMFTLKEEIAIAYDEATEMGYHVMKTEHAVTHYYNPDTKTDQAYYFCKITFGRYRHIYFEEVD